MDGQIKAKVDEWLNGEYDAETKNEIKRLLDTDEKELADAFYTDLKFGTGGMRGVIGVGTNRMNKYTVGKAALGLARYIVKTSKEACERGCAVAYDSRRFSKEFADITAEVLSAEGVKVHLFKNTHPTPALSYAVRKLNAQAGVVITASHNPKEYNGFKAYWEDGGQMVPPHDKNVLDEVAKVKTEELNFGDRTNISIISDELDEEYLKDLKSLTIDEDAIKRQKDMKIVYTPLHGAGYDLTPRALKLFGFENVDMVEEQAKPDGEFPTTSYPNPESPEALTLMLKKAKEVNADIAIASDPDCDRMGAAVLSPDGNYELITGNQIGTLLTYYILESKKEKGNLPEDGYIVSTIVSTDMARVIAEDYGVSFYSVLTGFKWIADFVKSKGKGFLFGFEESYGYLVGDFARDKDGVIAACLLSELAAYIKDKGSNIIDLMNGLYVKYGYHKAVGVSITKKGQEGSAEIAKMLDGYKNNPPAEIGGLKCVKRIDYENRKAFDSLGNEIYYSSELPPAKVYQFILEDGSTVSVRPSGTEPKIKYYIEVKSKNKDVNAAAAEADSKIEKIKETFITG